MNAERGTVFVTLLVVTLVALVSGPLVPAVDVTAEGEDRSNLYRAFGDDVPNVGVEERLSFDAGALPENGTLTEGEDGYTPRLAPVRLDVAAGGEAVTVLYVLEVPALDHSIHTTRSVPAGGQSSLRLTLPADAVPDDRVEDPSYEGRLELRLRQGNRTYTAGNRTVTLEVDG